MPNQYEIFAELCADDSSWINTRNYPSSIICRNMLCLADFASADEQRWRTIRLLLECPELSFREAAAILHLPLTRVYRYSKALELGGEVAEPPPPVDPAHLSLTARRGLRLASFAAAEPLRWQLLRCSYRTIPFTRRRMAELFHISPARAARLLTVPHLSYPEDFR